MPGVEITKVQQWVATAMVFTVGMISTSCIAGYSALSQTMADNGNAVGLWVMGGLVGLMTMVGCLLIHHRSPLSPWLLVGLVPTAVAGFALF
jgi:hypothetical protein